MREVEKERVGGGGVEWKKTRGREGLTERKKTDDVPYVTSVSLYSYFTDAPTCQIVKSFH